MRRNDPGHYNDTNRFSRDSAAHRYQAAPKKRSAFKTVMIVFFAILLIAVVAVAAAIAIYVGGIDKEISIESDDRLTVEEQQDLKQALQPAAAGKAEYILVLGSDARPGEKAARSDTIILTRLDPEQKRLTFISIPRDTKVELPGHGTQKINAAMAFGGPAGAVRAVSDFAGVPITHYAEVRFENLTQLIDDMGGVNITIPEGTAGLAAGPQKLNGAKALEFARNRKSYGRGDFQRADNQRVLLEALLRQVLKSPVTEMPGTIQSLSKHVTTDYNTVDLVNLAMTYRGDDLVIHDALVPSTTSTINGISYVLTKQDEWKPMMERVDQGLSPLP